MGHFKVQSVTDLSNAKVGDLVQESDYATIAGEKFVQLEYVSDDTETKIHVKPGIWSIDREGPYTTVKNTSFSSYELLKEFIHTSDITNRADCFFRNIHKYKEFGIEVPTRKMLLYGAPGGGKSASISVVCNEYIKDGKTAVIIWHTDKFEDYEIRDFFKGLEYTGVDRLILVVEDLGGISREDGPKYSSSSLLSLLDNQERIFTIPTLIIATTNFPEMLLGNLANRPQRFDDKIEIPKPDDNQREQLLKFFYRQELDDSVKKLVRSQRAKELTPSHLREVVIRSAIYEISLEESLSKVIQEIEEYQNNFSKREKIGIT